MPFEGITYRVTSGHDEQVAWIFSPENFIRVDSPVLHDTDGEEIGYLTCTGLFLQGDTMVRVIQHEGGTRTDIRRHMSEQAGVHEAERQLEPYLATPRDTSTPAAFAAHFDRSTMTVLDCQQVDNRPAAGLVALRYRILPGHHDLVCAAFAGAGERLTLPGDGHIIALLLLAKDDVVVRVVQYEGAPVEAVTASLQAQSPAAARERWLAPFLAEAEPPGDLVAHVARHRMRCISHLSAAAVS